VTHPFAFVLCLAGLTALAFATRRQQRDIIGGPLRVITTYVLRFIGACALLLALGFLVARVGWSLGLVMFSGHTSLTAAIVYCALIGLVRWHAPTLRHRQGARAPLLHETTSATGAVNKRRRRYDKHRKINATSPD
jgi:hypothetical protein